MGSSSSSLDFAAAVRALNDKPVGLNDHAVWRNLFTSHFSTLDLAAIVSADAVRALRNHRTENLASLLFKCVEQVQAFVNARGRHADSLSAENAIRVLAKVLPFALEPFEDRAAAGAESTAEAAPSSSSAAAAATADGIAVRVESRPLTSFARTFVESFFVRNLCCDDADPTATFPVPRPMHAVLTAALLDACFVPDFSIGARQVAGLDAPSGHPHVDPGLLWAAGVGSDPRAPIHSTEQMTTNRRLLLNALIALLTRQLYNPDPLAPDELFRGPLTSVRATPRVATLVCSLTNVVIQYNPLGALPYTSHLISGAEDLVFKSTQVLNLLLDYTCLVPPQPPAPPREEEEGREAATNDAAVASARPHPFADHAVWSFFCDCSADEVRRVLSGLRLLVSNYSYARSTRLPGSQRNMLHHEEFVVLLWKLLDRCPNFLAGFCQSPIGLEFVVPLLDMALAARESSAKFPIFQVVVFMLLRLSAIRDFCVGANAPLTEYLPFALPHFTGSYADLIVLAMHAVIMLKHEWLLPVQESCAVIIANMSPYMTAVSPTVAQKLVALFEQMSRPSYLTLRRSHPNLLMLITEALANMIQYQFVGAAHVLYGLVRAEKAVRAFHAAVADKSLPVPPAVLGRLHAPTLLCAVNALEAVLVRELQTNPGADPVAVVARSTLVGELPVPHHIVTRRFETKQESDAWLSSIVWGLIYVHNGPHPIANPDAIKLFRMQLADA